MQLKTLVICLLVFTTTRSNAGLSTVSASSWMVFDEQANFYFNKLTSDLYFPAFGYNFHMSTPLLLSVKQRGGNLQSTFAAGDFQFYAGKTVKGVELRLGMAIPLFYPTNKQWIGSKNIKFRTGFGFNSSLAFDNKATIGGEIMAALSLNNLGARLSFPSSDLYGSAKISFRPSINTKAGVELLASAKYSLWNSAVWSKNGEAIKEVGLGIMPQLFGEYKLTEKKYLSAKVGVGKSFKHTSENEEFFRDFSHSSISSSVSLAFNSYFKM